MTFTAVVVIHESAEHLERLLDSMRRYLDPLPQLVVIDTGSRDGGADLARERGAEVVALAGNPGFGAANNAGVDRARHEVTVLINPDCELLDASLATLAARAAGRDALLAPRLLDRDGSVQRSAHPLPGRAAALVPALVPGRLLPAAFEPYRSRTPRRAGWAVAACLAARTDLLRRLGPFDPRAFLFYEDMDLCLRARAAGAGTVVQPDVLVRHVGGHATNPAFGGEAFDLQARRRRAVVRATLGTRALALDDAAQALTFATRAAAGRERARNLALLRAFARARGR